MTISPLTGALPDFGSPTLQGLEAPEDIVDGQRIGGNNRRQFVRFYTKKFMQPYAQEVRVNERTGAVQVLKTGLKEVEWEMVNIVTPGDKNVVDDRAQDFHKRSYFQQYKNFRDGKGVPMGQPIEECSYVAPEVCTELKYLNVHVEEQLADASDILCEQLPNGFQLREFARANCKARSDNAATPQVAALRAEMEKLQSVLSAQAQELAAMKSGIVPSESEAAEAPKKRGRPAKVNLEA